MFYIQLIVGGREKGSSGTLSTFVDRCSDRNRSPEVVIVNLQPSLSCTPHSQRADQFATLASPSLQNRQKVVQVYDADVLGTKTVYYADPAASISAAVLISNGTPFEL